MRKTFQFRLYRRPNKRRHCSFLLTLAAGCTIKRSPFVKKHGKKNKSLCLCMIPINLSLSGKKKIQTLTTLILNVCKMLKLELTLLLKLSSDGLRQAKKTAIQDLKVLTGMTALPSRKVVSRLLMADSSCLKSVLYG